MSNQSAIDGLRTNGFTIVRSLMSREKAISIGDCVLKTIEECKGKSPDRGYLGNYLAHDANVTQLLVNKCVLEICGSALGKGFRVSMVTGTIHHPEMNGGGFHRDWPHKKENAFYVPSTAIKSPVHLVAIWMLSDFSKQNGGTTLVSGSHLWPERSSSALETLLSKGSEEAIQAVGVAGSVLILDARLWHAISANRDLHPRVALICRYAASWLNLNSLNSHSFDREFIVNRSHSPDPLVARLPRDSYEELPEDVRALVYPLL